MNKIWKEAFDQIHAQEDLKQRTEQYLKEQIRERNRPVRTGALYKGLAAAACVLVLAAGAGGGYLFFTPTAYISVDINPSLELEINRFDRIISVTGYNEDGEDLSEKMDLKFLTYEDAIQEILDSQDIQNYLDEDGILSFTVAGEDENQSGQILHHVESCTEGNENMHCHAGGMDEVHEAKNYGLSVGRYRAYLKLKEYDASITPEELNEMSMAQIQDLLNEYEKDSSTVLQNEDGCTQDRQKQQEGNGGHHGGQSHGHNGDE